jgi:Phosphotransferase enzyme family
VTVDDAKAESSLGAWIERRIGGRVVRIERLERWRPAWDVDVERDGAIVALHARGEREPNFAIPWRIADEMPTHDLLERAGLPVPHAYGLCEEPYALVMDRLPGFVDLSFAASDEERFALIEEYLQLQAKIYEINLADAAAAGFDCPTDARGIALGSFMKFEEVYDALMAVPDPVTEFLRLWLHRNYPPDRVRSRFITYDAFQFMFEGGRITGLLDFELAHVGDPMMDLAALRIRDTIKNLGDLPAIAARYAEVTGEEVDHDVVDYHTVMYNAITVLSASPPLASPVGTTDLMSHMAWYVNSARWAFEVMADILGIELAPVDPPTERPSRHRAAFQHLANGTRRPVERDEADYERATLHRVARHLLRVDQVGREVEESDLDDLEALLGVRPGPEKADDELLGFIAGAGPAHDEALVRLLDRRVQRQHLLMAPEGSLMLRHPRLRSLRPGISDETRDEDRWPPGAIPGTG